MASHRLAVAAFTTLALAASGMPAYANDDATANQPDRVTAWATKLGLSDQQREQVRSIRADYDKQADPVEEQLWKLYHEEYEAMKNALTDEQRAKLPSVVKTEMNKECQAVATKIGISEDQKQKIEKIREEYEPKFREFCTQSTEAARKKVHELKAEFFGAVRRELTDDQRTKFWGVLREEFRQWRDPVARHERLSEIADQLGVTPDEKTQLKKIYAEYQPKIDELASRVKDLWREERTAVEKVLTDEQRTKAQEMWKMPEVSK